MMGTGFSKSSVESERNADTDIFTKHKADVGCCNFVEHQIEIEESSVSHWKAARRMTPLK